MGNTNFIVVDGRLTKDPEVKVVASGATIATLSVAVNRSVKKDGEWEDIASFFDVKVFGKLAEKCNRIVKGKLVSITGRLEQERWVSEKDGKPQSKVVIIADTVNEQLSLFAKQSSDCPF